jgi:peptidyl-prolyl cis-trans isomerase B (cyclophilin B)
MKVAVIDTDRGTIRVELFDDKAPNTVANFEKLASDGYYDGLVFHRVIDNFMIQGGCPDGTGMGGPGYTFGDEFHSELRHEGPGILSMANSGPNTNGSQFFITHVATPWLDGKHSVFGRVAEGQEIVDSVQQGDTMKSVKIEES